MHEQARAERAAAAMLANDAATPWFGAKVEKVGTGYALASLTVQSHHLNGHGSCHGGVIFALADTAFAVACNSRNQRAVAQHNQITYLSPGALGETLIAEAQVTAEAGRTAVTDVTVSCDGRTVAMFRGNSRQIPGQHFEED